MGVPVLIIKKTSKQPPIHLYTPTVNRVDRIVKGDDQTVNKVDQRYCGAAEGRETQPCAPEMLSTQQFISILSMQQVG